MTGPAPRMHTQSRRGFSMRAIVTNATACLTLAAALSAQQPTVQRYTYRIELPASGRHISVDAQAALSAPLIADTVAFDLDGAMHVRSVTLGCGEQRENARFERTGTQVRVAISPAPSREAPRADAMRCVRLAYDGEPADGLFISTDSAGRWTAFGDNFPNRARYWLAGLDDPSHKAQVTFVVTAPAGRTVVANGALVGTTTDAAGRVTTTWREDRPIPTYGMVIAAAPLVRHDLGPTACGLAEVAACVPQMVWTAPEQARFMPGHFARAGDIVEFFARTVGPFPYEKLGHLQSTTRWGGMENPSAIFYFDRAFRTPNGASEGLIAHETAHQWFGDAVTEREWAHAWLSEGFATFFAALWTQRAHGDSAYAAELAQMRAQVIAAPVVAQRAVIDSVETDPNALLNANTYQKGGFVLSMLREQLGDSAFFGGVRAYYAAHRHANAMTQDLQLALERSSGQPLGWFFDQWLRRPGWAEVRTSWTWDAASGRLTLTAEQGTRFGAYRLPVTVEVTDSTGVRQRVTVLLEARERQSIILPGLFRAAPTSVTCDPTRRLLAVFRAT